MRLRYLVSLIAILFAVALVSVPQPSLAQDGGETCEQLVQRALSELGTTCANLDGNSVCYGFESMTVTPALGAEIPQDFFTEPGYRADLNLVETVTTSKMDLAGGTWGLGVMYVQTDTPGQNAVYLMMGDVAVMNKVAPDAVLTPNESRVPMQAFDFLTGQDAPLCASAPPSVLVIQAPDGAPFDFTANGENIHLSPGAVLFLRTIRDTIELTVANGSAGLDDVTLPAGVAVPIGPDGRSGGTIPGQDAWESFGALEDIPDNIWTIYINPAVIQPSGIGEPEITIITKEGSSTPIPPKAGFVRTTTDYGELGQPLDRPAWPGIQVGGATCPEWPVYHSDQDGDWDIYRLDGPKALDSNNISQGDGSADLQPSYSQDGEWITFASNRDALGSWEIRVVRLDASENLRVTYSTGADVNPVWGPEGLIVFESNRDGNWELYMVDVTTTDPAVRLTNDPANDINAFWSPDGTKIVFQNDQDGDWEIYMLDINTGELTQLTDNATEDQEPALSHDGTAMVWTQMDDFGVFNLWIMDMASGAVEQLTDTGTNIAGQVFSPDDTFVAFFTNADGDQDVYVVDIATGLIKLLTDNDVEDRAPTFYCDMPIVLYHTNVTATEDNPYDREIFQVNPLPIDGPPNLPERLTEDEESDNVYPLGDPREEINSKQGRVPSHPER